MKIRNRFAIRLLARCLAAVLRLWFRTVRWRIVTETDGTNPYQVENEDRFLYCLWHDAILGVIFARPHPRMAGLVSWHADGSYVADIMEVFRIRPIRGSSGKRGAAAVRQMVHAARDWHIAIATDGPRGPRREVKVGILYLASQTGRGIVPTAVAANRAWRPRGRWTDMVIPWPFTRAAMLGGNPIYVPPGLRPDQLEAYRCELQREMDRINELAERWALHGDEKLIDDQRRLTVTRRAA